MTVSAFSVYLALGPTPLKAGDFCPDGGGDGSTACQYDLYNCVEQCGGDSSNIEWYCSTQGSATGSCCHCYT